MERKIKFKVWDSKSNSFLENIPIVEEWIGSDCWDDPEQALEHPYEWTVAPTYNGRLTWLQYINATDINGQEIYDRDILKSGTGEFFTVKWDDEEMRWKAYSKDEKYFAPIKKLEVVGNVFENFDLLDTLP